MVCPYLAPEKPPPGLSPDGVRDLGSSRVHRQPVGLELRPYRKDTIRALSKAGGRGVIVMVTGSDDTLTALVLASKVAERNQPLALIAVCR